MAQINAKGENIMVKPIDLESTTKSGLILSTPKDKPQYEGIVAFIGEEVTKFMIGEHILFTKYSPEELEYDGQKYFVIKEEDVLASVTE